MRNRPLLGSAWIVLLASLALGCAGPAPAPRPEAAIPAEALRLRAEMLAQVPRAESPDPGRAALWIAEARAALAASGHGPAGPELALIVDRAPAVQRAALVLLRSDGDWAVLAAAPVSTGATGRRGYFVTPTGVFANDGSITGYRALGTPNAQGIRGLGARGMRAWDFGWNWAARGWTTDGSEAPIRFLLHATDPGVLEPRLGTPGSQGCIRIGAAMNRFLDANGILDADLEARAAGDPRVAALLLPDRRPSLIAGRLLIVVDSRGGVRQVARPAPPPRGQGAACA